jgi:hypothetical protein
VKDILRYKNILLSIIIIAVSIFVIKGLWTKHSLIIKDLEKKMSDVEKGKLLIEKWNKVSNEYDGLKKNFFMKDQEFFKNFLEEKTKNYGINVTYLSPTRKQENFYSEMSFSLRATSESYATIVNFLNALEEKKVIIEILKVRGAENKKRLADITVKSFIIEQ